MGSRVPHVSLLVKFSVLTFVCVAVLGGALAVALRQQILGHAASSARDLAMETADEVADDHITPADLQKGFSDEKLRQIDRSIEMLLLDGTIRNAKIYDGNARLVYSLKREEIGEQEDGEVYAALAGETVGGFEESEELDRRGYEVYTPLRFVGSTEPAGAFELYLPYEPIAERVEADTRRLYIVLA